MNLATLEQIVGPINRGQLGNGFKTFYEPVTEDVPEFFSDDQHKPQPPPLTEDFSHLNGRGTKRMQEVTQGIWKRLTPQQRQDRLKNLSAAGKKGGSATKDMRHLHGVVINRRKKT